MKLIKTLTLSAFLAVTLAPAAFAESKHGADHSGMDHSTMHKSGDAMEGAVHAKAVINSIGNGVANVSHGPIPEIGWPAMTMDLNVMEGASMADEVNAGDEVTLMLVKDPNGMYAIGGMTAN